MNETRRRFISGFLVTLVATSLVVGVVGFIAINAMIPWEEICAVVGPAREMAGIGSALLTDLEAWLAQANDLLTMEAPETTTEARTGLGGLIGRATEVAEGAVAGTVNVLTAPLRDLIDHAQTLLAAVREAVDAARAVLESVDEARCS